MNKIDRIKELGFYLEDQDVSPEKDWIRTSEVIKIMNVMDSKIKSLTRIPPRICFGEWISLQDAIPPFDTTVLLADNENNLSMGRITYIETCRAAVGMEKVLNYTWSTTNPTRFFPSFWMYFPKIEKK